MNINSNIPSFFSTSKAGRLQFQRDIEIYDRIEADGTNLFIITNPKNEQQSKNRIKSQMKVKISFQATKKVNDSMNQCQPEIGKQLKSH